MAGHAKDEVNENETKAMRKQRRKEKRQEKRALKRSRKVRLVPIWLRLVLIVVLFAAMIVLGLLFGYRVIGGGEGYDILQWETWTDLYDYISG
ncbi:MULTISPECIES: DNA-directed RNA polymerase subunit beta [Geomicrobium]|uniref:Type VI protein secretion system component VasF n=1 Tax=Geomicrobium sediminis TaxID=1347788 RepID=A0ABS2P7N5_9BACL|nr:MULTISPECIES: DNA-directed RNA polymerase subunit beta [Geomicrobium]MBM7631410.1 type VI protein secretion system component VasF [Geomicrobium sediminis]GAJ97340.1 hypothetical protein JCM19055_191 [Geomicrobium sp. JCM 19055]